MATPMTVITVLLRFFRILLHSSRIQIIEITEDDRAIPIVFHNHESSYIHIINFHHSYQQFTTAFLSSSKSSLLGWDKALS